MHRFIPRAEGAKLEDNEAVVIGCLRSASSIRDRAPSLRRYRLIDLPQCLTTPPCASCHGDDAKGNGEFPRLAGQLPDYIFRKLTGWDSERHSESSTIMQPIAHELSEAQIKAVAAFVSQLN